MTTETSQDPRHRGTGVLLRAAAGALAGGVLLTVLGALISGAPAAWGAAVGSLLTVVVYAWGTFVVNAVAGAVPALSLVVALMTYAFQVVLVAAVLVGLSRSEMIDDTVDRLWVTGAVIGVTLVWMIAQVVAASRVRMPVYDLVSEPIRASAPAESEGLNK